MSTSRPTRPARRLLLLGSFLVLAVLLLVSLHYFLGGGGIESPSFNLQAVLLAVLTAINVLFILTLLLVMSRYLVKLFFEKKGKPFFASVKTKLTVAFTVLAIVPTALFVFFSYEVINQSVIQWFSAPAEELLHSSEELARGFYASTIQQTQRLMEMLVEQTGDTAPGRADLDRYRVQSLLDAILLLDPSGKVRYRSEGTNRQGAPLAIEDPQLVLQNAYRGRVSYFVENHPAEDVVLCFTPAPWSQGEVLVFAKRIPGSVAYRSFRINEAYQEYFQLKNQVELIRLNYFFIVGFGSVILLFGFVWFGMYISKKITVPILALVEGSRRVSQGDLSSPIECEANDEFEVLIQSFNHMMEDLKRNKVLLEEVNQNLQNFNQELERRNAFIQTVLNTIAAGVVSVDKDLTITISNPATRHLIKQRRIQDGTTRLPDILPVEKMPDLLRLLKETEFHPQVSREIPFWTGKRTIHFAVTASAMRGAEQETVGYVIVFDDVSDLIKAEKAAAWQEVAKRLAHQIKNPLTPIHLFVERIRKQFARLQEEGTLPGTEPVANFREILDEALQSVQSETQNLKYLVEEFTRFARLPSPSMAVMDLNQLVEEVVAARFAGGAAHAEIVTRLDPGLPGIVADRDLIRNVLVNLVDNAIESIEEVGELGRVSIETVYDPASRGVRLTVEDDGKGISEEKWEHLFLPYFSTKKQGMGLGLTIVKKILDDHEAAIRVEPVSPRGCRFVVEFGSVQGPGDGAETV
jgi:two-component system nitrogen regulation sensor histidine kinase NtrY